MEAVYQIEHSYSYAGSRFSDTRAARVMLTSGGLCIGFVGPVFFTEDEKMQKEICNKILRNIDARVLALVFPEASISTVLSLEGVVAQKEVIK